MRATPLLAIVLSVAALGSGCASKHRLELAPRTHPQQLAVLGTPPPGDARFRFREIFCALHDAEPQDAENPLPCDEVLHRLGGEPASPPTPAPPPLTIPVSAC